MIGNICPYGWKWDHESAACYPGPYAVTADCPEGYEFSVKDKKCVQKKGATRVQCWPGTEMNPATGKCEPVKPNVIATPMTTHQQVAPPGEFCPPGQVWNPVTRRCSDPDRAAKMQSRTAGVDLWGGMGQRAPEGSESMPRYSNLPKPPSTTTAVIVGALGGLLVGYALWNTRAVAR